MIRTFTKQIKRFWQSDAGSTSLEFALTFPAMMVIMLSGVELAFTSLKHSMLEKAVDVTVREIRLGTGQIRTHDEIKNTICSQVGFIHDCNQNLLVEMIPMDPRAWDAVKTQATCTDKTEEVNPRVNFENGQENELMFIRACAKIDPVFPGVGLGANFVKDGAGQYALVASSAFVQEPE